MKQCLYLIFSWILNLVCLEIQNLTANNNKILLKRLMDVLIDIKENKHIENYNQTCFENHNEKKSPSLQTNIFNPIYKKKSTLNEIQNNLNHEDIFDKNKDLNILNKKIEYNNNICCKKNKILDLISAVNLILFSPESLNLEYFDPNLMEKVIESSELKSMENTKKMKIYDLAKVKKILVNEISETSSNSSRINLAIELKYILNNVSERNKFQLEFFSRKQYIDSLKSIIESLILMTPMEIFDFNQRQKILISLLQEIFQKINQEEVFPGLTYSIASIIFILIKGLRDLIDQINKQNDTSMFIEKKKHVIVSEIFDKIIMYLLNSNLTNGNVRMLIYGTIINFMMIFDSKQQKMNSKNPDFADDEIGEKYFFNVFNKNYNQLLKIVSSDCCQNLQNISTMMAYSVLNKIMRFDNDGKWLKFLNENGYLSCIINSILQTDNLLLEESFYSEIKNEKIIYIFESKTSFLLSISQSQFGAQILLKNDLLSKLTSCTIFNKRKVFEKNIIQGQYSNIAIKLIKQYNKIFFPTIELLISILNALGHDNIQAKSEITKFVLKFSESIVHILESKQISVSMLEELKLITSLLCKVTPFDELSNHFDPYLAVEYNSTFSRIKKEIINLMNIYNCPEQSEMIKKDIQKYCSSNLNSIKKASSYILSIQINLIAFLCKSKNSEFSSLIFSTKNNINLNGKNSSNKNLEILITYIKFAIENFEKCLEFDLDLNSKEKNVSDLVEIEKKQIIDDYKYYEKLSENEKNDYLKEKINIKITLNKEESKNYKKLLEKLLLLVWRQTELYYSCLVDAKYFDLNNQYQKDKKLVEEFLQFIHYLNHTLNSNLLRRLNEIDQITYSPCEKNTNFINIIIRRIQRLIHLNSN